MSNCTCYSGYYCTKCEAEDKAEDLLELMLAAKEEIEKREEEESHKALGEGDKMKPGRELDALVAERVMGLEFCGCPDNGGCNRHTPNYSIDIAAAWQVVEKMALTVHAPGASFANGEYGNVYYQDESGKWYFEGKYWCVESLDGGNSYAPTAPLAICLAALEAMGHKTD